MHPTKLFLSLAAIVSLQVSALAQDASLQELIDQASNHSVIELEGRRYSSDQEVLIDKRQGLTLRGVEGTEIVCLNAYKEVVRVHASRDIQLEGIAIYHDIPTYGCSGGVVRVQASRGITITRCELNGCGVYGVHATNSVDLTIQDNNIHKNASCGIQLEGCEDVLISGNRLHNNGTSYLSSATTGVQAAGNSLEGKPWKPEGSSPIAPKLKWATTAADLAMLPADLERLALFDYEDATLLQLMRFASLRELVATPKEGSTGLHFDMLSTLPALRQLTIVAWPGMRPKKLAQGLATLEGLEELELRAVRATEPSFGNAFLGPLLAQEDVLPKLQALRITDPSSDASAEVLVGLQALSSLRNLSLSGLPHGSVSEQWLEPLAKSAGLTELALEVKSDEQAADQLLSENALDALAGFERLQALTLQGLDLATGIDLDFLVDLELLESLELRLSPLSSSFHGFGRPAFRSIALLKELKQLTLIGIAPDVELEPCTLLLRKLESLQELELDFEPAPDQLVGLTRPLHKLTLHAHFSDEGWAALIRLADWSNIRTLSLSGRGAVPGAFMEACSFRSLELHGFSLAQIDWHKLSNESNFLEFDITGCRDINRTGMRALAEKKPACRLRE